MKYPLYFMARAPSVLTNMFWGCEACSQAWDWHFKAPECKKASGIA